MKNPQIFSFNKPEIKFERRKTLLNSMDFIFKFIRNRPQLKTFYVTIIIEKSRSVLGSFERSKKYY